LKKTDRHRPGLSHVWKAASAMTGRRNSKAQASVFATALVAGLLGLSTACTAVVDGNLQPGATNSSAGSVGLGGAPTQVGGGATALVASGYKGIHQLNGNEYNATVADVLGTALRPANGSWRVYELNGFDNMADVQIVDTDQYQRYFDAASALADDALKNATFKAKYVTCATPDDACVSGIIGKLGLHIFRRPLSASEVANYKSVYSAAQTQGEAHEGALKYVLVSLLSSSEFLYRIELDPKPGSAEKHPLSSFELASRISYFLWSSAPDDGMLAAAADKSLVNDDTIKTTVDRLLADSTRAPRFVENFYGQWLGGRRVAEHAVAPDVYQAWNPTLAGSLAQEMYAYFADFLQSDRSWLEFLTADENFVDAPLAALYGMGAPSGAGLQKVQVTTDKRVGFLGLGGFLAQSSLDRRTSPTLRGRWIMINLLCTHPPAPPQDVPKIEVAAGATDLSKGNVRAVLEKHRANPTCANCHALFDPYGLPLEQFDGIGAYRTTYADGSAIVPDTTLLDGTQLKGMNELADSLTKDPRFKQCVADNMFSYGLGRVLAEADRGSLDGIQKQWNNDKDVPSIRRLIQAIVLDQSFRSRSGQAAP
jgi:Protein of unknown function (DUF1592)/Protein of unknown function (DUF1588)/Protein of unknown function (DUF1595)/Protein of unknown function (DUF1585)/Protein of unknown function (DUF1587)